MNVGTIVIHNNHSEWGFGTVKQVEEDDFGDIRLQVAFDHENKRQPCAPESLNVCASTEEAFSESKLGDLDTLRRKLLAGLVIGDNLRTGVFLRSTLKPLPHQVHFLDRVLSGKRFGHLAADDVGLGKTIEAGLLITHIYKESPQRKILILCPAGLALQWQDEMLEHFSLRFSVAGRDFKVNSSAGWDNRNLVIGSIDTLKDSKYLSFIEEAGPFDLVVADESHRLSATREFLSGDLRTTQSFRFVRDLVESRIIHYESNADGSPRSPKLLLLSATPHQGDDFRFALLLGLIRPDLFPGTDESITEHLTLENLFKCITKTPKSKAIDWEGKPIFKGHVTNTLEAELSEAETEVSRELSQYIRKSISARFGGGTGASLVVELCMHTFHKLAASSWKALELAMSNRLSAVQGHGSAGDDSDDDDQATARARLDEATVFYEDEEDDLEAIIAKIRNIQKDSKWELFNETVRKIEEAEPGAKILIFTQYYATQDYLVESLSALFPEDKSAIIRGSMSMDERRDARIAFENEARFLVCTESGGEGVNFQKACHVMINYDLPWNPMRLQQRIGRLDRYGQQHLVQVFNLSITGSWDTRITTRIHERLQVIQGTLGPITDSIEDYRDMILGEVGDSIDPRKAFIEHERSGHDISDEEIDRALRKAAEAADRTRELGVEKTAFNGLDEVPQPVMESDHFREAYKLCLSKHEIPLTAARTSEKHWLTGVYKFQPPETFREPRLRATKERYIVFDKERYAEVRGTSLGKARGRAINPELAGFGDAFTDWLFESAFQAQQNEREFKATISTDWEHGSGWLKIAALRWRGSLRNLNTPDTLMAIWISDDHNSAIELKTTELVTLIENMKPDDRPQAGAVITPPPDELGKENAQKHLKQLVGDDVASRPLAGWSWLATTRISVA